LYVTKTTGIVLAECASHCRYQLN